MKISDEILVCPYPGLRSFTEEESVYFKGRDNQIDQVCSLLQKNKFLMLTGASGEGKSSLIYAGMIPNAKAGFFKAQFTNWLVADFRPERTPLSNMATAVGKALSISPQTVETELARGYSSLVDLYLNSVYYTDEHDFPFQTLSESEKKEKRRNSANLLIIIDQFEEFFTNPENFNGEAPSNESLLVVNLALETARIALKRDLPVYVVCTMRSDFIGQCVSFRGLPEYIGFSQFFVPRLKRKDFKLVIEEPAMLSGNRITQRLIERLVYDLAEGVDQLPVLQHALSQIWLAAKMGSEELDLIHYAMVGGMPAEDLPDDDIPRFGQWLEAQPEHKKKYFANTGLHKIIEYHANTLYEEAWESYSAAHPEKPITIRDAKRIVAMTFACLTKIDNSRAVRNRMTLQEITNIINDPALTYDIVGNVLTIFRLESNSFLRPYITDEESGTIEPDTILDITHEALIRNWARLNQWALKEFSFYTTWIDFRKHLQRWKDHNKNSDFLLPIGLLTFFENWYDECRPNPAWIMRYSDSESKSRAGDSQALLDEAREYLKRSARKLIVSRTFMKYGTTRVALFASIIIMLVLSGFYWRDAESKRNETVLRRIASRAEVLVNSPEVDAADKAMWLLTNERYTKGTIMPALDALPNSKAKITVANQVYVILLTMDNRCRLPFKNDLSAYIERELLAFAGGGSDKDLLLKEVNKYMTAFVYDHYYNKVPDFELRVKSLTSVLRQTIITFYNDHKLFSPPIVPEINLAVQWWLTLGSAQKEEIEALIALISPYQEQGKKTFDVYYASGTYEAAGNRRMDFGGGYHMLASLYAANGDVENVLHCFATFNNLPEYFTGRLFNNYNNALGYLYQFGHDQKVPAVNSWITTNYPAITTPLIFKYLINRSGYINRFYFMNFIKVARTHQGNLHMNLCLMPREIYSRMINDYEKVLAGLKDPSERNFQLAIHYKRIAMFSDKYHYDRSLPGDTTLLAGWIDKAWQYFENVSPAYLERTVKLSIPYYTDGHREPVMTNRALFLYPDYMDGWFSRTYHTDFFYRHSAARGLIQKHYTTAEAMNVLYFWLAKAHEMQPDNFAVKYDNLYPIADSVLVHLAGMLSANGGDANLAHIILANRSFAKGETAKALAYVKKIKPEKIKTSAGRIEYLEQTFFANQVVELQKNLISVDKKHAISELTSILSRSDERTWLYIFYAEKLFHNSFDADAFNWLDSAMVLMKNENFNELKNDYRPNLVKLLGEIGGEKLNDISKDIVRNFMEEEKFDGVVYQVRGLAAASNYHAALTAMPASFTEGQELVVLYNILHEASRARDAKAGNTEWKLIDNYYDWDDNYIFYHDPFFF